MMVLSIANQIRRQTKILYFGVRVMAQELRWTHTGYLARCGWWSRTLTKYRETVEEFLLTQIRLRSKIQYKSESGPIVEVDRILGKRG